MQVVYFFLEIITRRLLWRLCWQNINSNITYVIPPPINWKFPKHWLWNIFGLRSSLLFYFLVMYLYESMEVLWYLISSAILTTTRAIIHSAVHEAYQSEMGQRNSQPVCIKPSRLSPSIELITFPCRVDALHIMPRTRVLYFPTNQLINLDLHGEYYKTLCTTNQKGMSNPKRYPYFHCTILSSVSFTLVDLHTPY